MLPEVNSVIKCFAKNLIGRVKFFIKFFSKDQLIHFFVNI